MVQAPSLTALRSQVVSRRAAFMAAFEDIFECPDSPKAESATETFERRLRDARHVLPAAECSARPRNPQAVWAPRTAGETVPDQSGCQLIDRA